MKTEMHKKGDNMLLCWTVIYYILFLIECVQQLVTQNVNILTCFVLREIDKASKHTSLKVLHPLHLTLSGNLFFPNSVPDVNSSSLSVLHCIVG